MYLEEEYWSFIFEYAFIWPSLRYSNNTEIYIIENDYDH